MKLPTKALIGFLAVFSMIFVLIVFVALPWVRGYLIDREVVTAHTYLGLASRQVRAWMDELHDQREMFSELGLPDADVEMLISQRESNIYNRLENLYAGFTFHDSGRLFLIDSKGRYVVRPISSELTSDLQSPGYAFDAGTRAGLMPMITSPAGRPTREFSYDVLDRGRGEVVRKQLFVSPVPSTPYYICLTVDAADLYYSAELAGTAMNAVLIVTVLVLVLGFLWFYRRLHRRYNLVMDGAARILAGDYERPIGDDSNDEIGILAQTLDRLAANMREKEELERQIRQIQRLDLVGSLASGVTHEFNNILTGIRSGLDLCLEMLNDDNLDVEGMAEALSIVQNCSGRGRETVDRLSTFFRDNTSNRQILDFNRLVEDAVELCRHTLEKQTSIETIIPPIRQVVEVDRNLIEQVLMNLIINARDAIGGKTGTIILTIARHAPSELKAPDGQTVTHDYVSVSVQDSGSGIDSEVASKIFDPYFTTKELGTGLGLSIAFKIVREHGGWITADSTPGQGSTFRVFLPTARRDLSDSQVMRFDSPRERRETSTGRLVMALPDSRELRELVKALSLAGYPATSACSKQSLENELHGQAPPRLVIVSPDLPNLDSAAELVPIISAFPKVRFLLLVDNKRDIRIADFLAAGCDDMISRPFTFRELEHVVSQSLVM